MEISSLVAEFLHAGRQGDGRDRASMRLISHEREICDFENHEFSFCTDIIIPYSVIVWFNLYTAFCKLPFLCWIF